MKNLLYNCIHCGKAFPFELTDVEFLRSKLKLITIVSTCPHCGTKHRCYLAVKDDRMTIRCEFA